MKLKGKKLDGLKLINWDSTESVSFQKQYILICAILLLIMMIYMVRLWYLQVLQGESYRFQSENNRIRIEDIAAPRGIIFDRNGVPIVENRPAYDLVIIREDIDDLDGTIKELARLCERNPDEFSSIIEANKAVPRFVPLRLLSDLDRDCLARVEARRIRLPGVVIQLEPKREIQMERIGCAPDRVPQRDHRSRAQERKISGLLFRRGYWQSWDRKRLREVPAREQGRAAARGRRCRQKGPPA